MADFATVAELEAITGMVSLGARGTTMLGYASSEIRGYVGQDIEVTTGRQEEFAGVAYEDVLHASQVPVTAVTAITVNAVTVTNYVWSEWGKITRTDAYWDTGPIVITYDSGWAAASDQMVLVKSICIEVAARALGGGEQDTFGLDAVEQRGSPIGVFLRPEEERRLNRLTTLPVG